MKKATSILAALVFICTFVFNCTAVFAAEYENAYLKSDKNHVRKGEELNLTLSLSGFNGTDEPVNVLKGTLRYDSAVFETPSQHDFAAQDTWESVKFNPENGKFILFTRSRHSNNEGVLKIKLTAKNDLDAGNTYLEISDIKVSSGREDMFPNDAGILLNVISDNILSEPLEFVENSDENNSTFSEKREDLTENNADEQGSAQNGKINILIASGVVLLLLLAAALIVYYLKKRETLFKKFLSVFLIFSATVLITAGSVYAFGIKGDINGDGLVDYADVVLLQKHLILLSSIEKSRENITDFNSDGKLTVTDLSLLIKKIEDKTDYNVTVTPALDKYIYEKSEEIIYKFNARVSNGAQIESVIINGLEYNVEKGDGDIDYTVSLSAGETAGILNLNLEKVKLKGGREVAVNQTDKIEVLKSVPSLAGFTAQELNDTAQMKISFEIIDEDLAVFSSGVEILKTFGDEKITVDFYRVSQGVNEFILDLEEDTPYTVYIYADYNRASGEIETSNDYSGSISALKELQLNIDYDFTFKNLNAETENGTLTNRFNKNQPIVLSFESSNNTKFAPENICVNNKIYNVKKSENKFYAVLDGFSQTGGALITADYLVLENGKKFVLEKDNTISVKILKQTPEIADLSLKEDVENNILNISFSLIDPDSTLTGHKIVVENENGNTAAFYELKKDELEKNVIEKSILLTDDSLTSYYTVKIIANRDISADGSEEEYGIVIASETFTSLPKAHILSGEINKEHAEKGEKIEIRYEIEHNVNSDIYAVVINNVEIKAENLNEKTVKAVVKAPEKAGWCDFSLTQIVFENKTEADVFHTVKAEILKTIPEVSDYNAQDIIEKEEVRFTFSLNDTDNAFLSAKAQLLSKDGDLIDEKEILSTGSQEFVTYVKEKTEYLFRVVVDSKRTQDLSLILRNKVIFEHSVYVMRDYQLQLSDIKTLNSGGESLYFAKKSEITVSFRAETASSLAAQSAFVNGVKYQLAELGDNYYEFSFIADSAHGVKKLVIEKIVMENGRELLADKNNFAEYEVLKSAPNVKNFRAEKEFPDNLKVNFEIEDYDKSLINAAVKVTDGGGEVIIKTDAFVGDNEIIAGLTDSEEYSFEIISNYDLDTNTFDADSNLYQNDPIFFDSVSVPKNDVQFKDVSKIKLYKKESGNIIEKEIIDITSGLPKDPKNYFAVIEMKNLPDFYSSVKEFRFDYELNRLSAVLDQNDLIYYDENGVAKNEFEFRVAHRDSRGDYPVIKSAQELFDKMAADPGGSFELTEDLDAHGLSLNSTAVLGVFSGELNGNGYSILNLQTSLFQTLSGASIKNLVIDNAEITTSLGGILADIIRGGSVIDNVYVTNSTISNSVDELGAFASNLNDSVIKESACVNVAVKGLVAVGGIAGKTNGSAVIENCYVTGSVQGTYDHPTLGARVGGIVGWHGSGRISNCYSKVNIIAPADKGNGGIIGGPNEGNPVIENTISLSDGDGWRIAGFDVLQNAKNVYEYSNSSSMSNITQSNSANISETADIFKKELYKNELNFDESIWNLDLLKYGKLPSLISSPLLDNNFDIPEYSLLTAANGYRPEMERAYANMAKLMPFADINMWIEYGNKLKSDDILALKTLEFVLPLDSNGSFVSAINSGNMADVKKIRLVFDNEKMHEYDVSYLKTSGDKIAVYMAAGGELIYQPAAYISDYSGGIVDSVMNMVENWDYAYISELTKESESRLYADYYNESVKPYLRNLIENIIYSQHEFPLYCDNEAVNQLTAERLNDETLWKKFLYAYNYFDKWYGIDYKGVMLSDIMFFNPSSVNRKMTTKTLCEKLLSASAAQRETHRTVDFYNLVLMNYTGKSLMDFLGDLSLTVGGYDEPSDWFAANFKGILKEQAPYGGTPGINYRIWDILCGLNEARKSIILPILTAPQEDMYLISVPSQLLIGSLNRYNEYLVKDGGERERMQKIIDVYASKMGIFFGVSSMWYDGSAEKLNSFVNIHYDTRLNFPQSDAADAGDQDKDKTRDPVMKWVYEANNTIGAKNGSAASADGTNVYWMQDAALGTSDYSFFTFSHETAHNQDGRYFYNGAGRRVGTGGEAHADGNISQEMRDGCMVFNISKINDFSVEMTNNFSYERIDSKEKLKSYYAEMFETGYVLDYLAAKAFLLLDTQQQAAVAVQASHTSGGNSSFSTQYTDISEKDIENMNLNDISDLWKNKISIRNIKKGNTEKVPTATDGSYGFESFYNMNWYQPHNDFGSPDTHSFKRLGMEMLGVGGYEGGYMIYMSALSDSDLDALRQITGDDNITWEEYKLRRFKKVEENLDNVKYFDVQDVIQQFKEAFEKDAQNGTRSESIAVKRLWYGIIKRSTGDFTTGGIYDYPKSDIISK